MDNTNEKIKETSENNKDIKNIIIEMLDSYLDQNKNLSLIETNIEQMFNSLIEENEDYSKLMNIVENTKAQIAQFLGILKTFENLITKNLEEKEKKEKFSEIWWKDSQKRLNSLTVENNDKAFDYWMQLYSETLVNDRLDLCLKLTQESYEFLNKFDLGKNYFQDGTNALMTEEYEQALNMLKYLVNNGLKYQTNESINLTYALLNIFIGRYYLYEDSNQEQAKLYFDKALSLSPEDGRPYAGLGSYYLEEGDYDEATRQFSQALLKSPNQPEGYVGRGLIFELQENLSDAENWYNKAINHIAEEEDIVGLLNMLLAKGSASLYLQVAQFIHKNKGIDYKNQALKAVELALNLAEEHSENEREAYRIRGDILNEYELHNEAAEAYYEAGRRYYWAGKYDIAEELFYKVQRINENLIENYWYLADTLRIQAYKVKYPYVKEKIIIDAVKNWDMGFNIENPKIEWPYLTRAMISDRMALIEEEDRKVRYWEGVAYIECALAFNEEPMIYWSTLMSLYINLELEPAAIQIMLMHSEEGEKNNNFLESQAILLSNIGEYKEALNIAKKRSLLEELPWILAIEGYNNLYLKAYDKALHLFEEALQKDATFNYRQWIPFQCAMCYRILGSNVKAKNKFKEIWEYFENQKDDYIKYHQSSEEIEILFYLDGLKHLDKNIAQVNFLDQIIKLATDELNNKYITKGSIYFSYLFLGLVYLKKYNFKDGKKFLDNALETIKTKGHIDFTIELILELEQQLFERLDREGDKLNKETQNNSQRAHQMIVEFQNQLEDHIEDFGHLSLRDEDERIRFKNLIKDLEDQIERFREEGKTEGYAWIGLNATLVRWYEFTKNWSNKLYDAYKVLLTHQKMFPVIDQKLKSILDNLRNTGNIRLEEGDLKEALKLFEHALNFIKLSDIESLDYVRLLSSIGFIYFKTNKKDQAIEIWKQAIEVYKRVRKSEDNSFNETDVSPIPVTALINPGRFIGGVCLSILKKIEDCWSLINYIEEYISAIQPESPYITEFNEFKIKIFDFFNQHYQLKKESTSSLISVVTPIAVEIGSRLVPPDDEDWDFLRPEEGIIVKMRKRIEEHMNIKIPGIRVRGNETDLSPNQYVIMLNEIPIKQSEVKPKMGYCLKPPEEIQREFPEFSLYNLEVTDPITGNIGCWIPKEYWEVLDNNGFEYWKDPMIFIARHIEAILYQNLGNFLGIQGVENLLNDWEEENYDNQFLRDAVLPNQKSQVIFARILQNLVKEKIPIISLNKIFEVVNTINLIDEDMDAIIRKIRLELKTQLPGNEENIEYRYIGPVKEFEDILDGLLGNEKEKKSLTIPPETMSDLLTMLRDIVDFEEKNQVLVIKQAELRTIARDIVNIEFPYLIVIAEEELIR